jgi:hypothetical protein
MTKRRQSELKSNPVVRFVRWVRKLFRSLFKTQRSSRRAFQEEMESDRNGSRQQFGLIGLENFPQGRSITVGELFDRVQWQLTEPAGLETASTTKIKSTNSDPSWN